MNNDPTWPEGMLDGIGEFDLKARLQMMAQQAVALEQVANQIRLDRSRLLARACQNRTHRKWARPQDDMEHTTLSAVAAADGEVNRFIDAEYHKNSVAGLEGDKMNLLSRLRDKQLHLNTVLFALGEITYYAEKAVEAVDWAPDDLRAFQVATRRGRNVLDGIFEEER